MTVDTAVKIVEEEKCGLDMSSCENLHSSATSAEDDVGGNGSGDCNVEGKEDYVFVNGTDGAFSDDRRDNNEGGEVNVAESSSEEVERNGQLGIGDLESDGLDNGVREEQHEVDGGESKVENVSNVGDEAEGGGLVKENGGIKVESEVEEVEYDRSDCNVESRASDVDKVLEGGETKVEHGDIVGEESEDGALVKENGEINMEIEVVDVEGGRNESNVEGRADVEDKVSEQVESSDSMPVVDEVKDEEIAFENPDNGNASVDDIVSRAANVDNREGDILVGDSVSTDVEGQGSTTVGSVPDAPSDQEIVAHNDPVAAEVPLPSDGETTGLPLNNGMREEQTVDCRLQDLQPADGEAEDMNLNEAELAICEQVDLDHATDGESQNMKSVDSEAVGSELDLSDVGESEDYIGPNSIAEPVESPVLQIISSKFEEKQNQDNSGTAFPGVKGPASFGVGQPDESKRESESGAEESVRVSMVDVQSVITDESAVKEDPTMCNGNSSSELTAEVRGNQEASAVEDVSRSQVVELNESVDVIDKEIVGREEALAGVGVSLDQVAEQIDSVDVSDKEVSLEDHSSETPVMVEDATSLSKVQPPDGLGIGGHCNDHGDSHDGVCVPEDVTASDASSSDAKSCLRSDDIYPSTPLDSVAELPAVSDSVTSKEQGVLDDSSVSLSGSADGTSSMMKLEISDSSLRSPVSDVISETKSLNDAAHEVIKPNNVSESTLEPMISFGSFTCATPLQNGVKLQTDKPKSSSGFSSVSSNSTINFGNGVTIKNPQANGVHSSSLNHDSVSGQVAPSVQINEVSESTAEGLEAESSDYQNANPDLVRSPFYWLIKIPYFEDEELKDQRKQSEAQHTEKTQIRDAIMAEYQKRKASLHEPKAIFDAARSEEKAARELMTAKKKEIESAHSLINLAKHVLDVDTQIRTLDHRYNHETVELKEERDMIRELNRLKKQREQLCANSQGQEEVQQALEKKNETEDHLKVLKNELDALRENHARASERVLAAKDKYDKEIAVLNNLNAQLTSANRDQQEAYNHDRGRKRLSYEKNKFLYKYRDDLKIAKGYADAGRTDLLERHCINHVEEIMEVWNKNDEFRKEYVLCNMKSILWKFGTKDGRRLGPDEKQQSLENVQKDRINSSAKVKSVTAVSNVERDFPVLEATKSDVKLVKKVVEPVNKAAPPKLHEAKSKNSLAEVSGRSEIIEEDKQAPKLTKEEEELARKAEQLRKDEEAARLKEQRRLEEKIKAQEALERKKRIAERKQAKAEFKARKEAEEKEKERQRRANKKEKKRGINLEITENELPKASEPAFDAVRDSEGTTGNPATVARRPKKASLHTKQIKTATPIPPALRNRGRRGILRYWPYASLVLVAIVLLFLGNLDSKALMQQISGLLH